MDPEPPMTDGDENLDRALQALREEYLIAAPRRIAELWAALARVQNGDRGALAALGMLAHRLAGSAGSYGLPAVSQQARDADELCRALAGAVDPPRDTQITHLRDLVQSIADAFAKASAPE